MLETESALDTRSIPPQNADGSSFETFAELLPPHRKAYLNYEGEVSGNRGSVRRIDAGTYVALSPDVFLLDGQIFSGTLTVSPNSLVFEKTAAIRR
ncbi:MAG: hypothetical protein LBT89_09085 [Planctomycetaceae bacterium]|jgi:hypothetical protein|nr:hypothetical protein [Planctomycetaceae bacterium]